jgi:two-component system LytT family response regulator
LRCFSSLENIRFQTIFTTSHSHYAIKAFRFNALDYLVKPINESELDEAVKRLLKSANNSMEVKNALSNLEVAIGGKSKIGIASREMGL